MALPNAQGFLPPGMNSAVYKAYNQVLKRTAITLKAWELGYRSDLTDAQMDEAAEKAGQGKPTSPSTREAIREALASLKAPITDDTDPETAHHLMMEAVTAGRGVGFRRWNGRLVLIAPFPTAD